MAVYRANAPNTDGVTHNASCSDTNENVTVTSVGSSLTDSTELGANDSERRSSAPAGGNLAGTVSFKLYALDRLPALVVLPRHCAALTGTSKV